MELDLHPSIFIRITKDFILIDDYKVKQTIYKTKYITGLICDYENKLLIIDTINGKMEINFFDLKTDIDIIMRDFKAILNQDL